MESIKPFQRSPMQFYGMRLYALLQEQLPDSAKE